MKAINKSMVLLSFLALLFVTPTVYSQTAGTLSFSTSTSAPTGDWGNKHVLAIWIENTNSPSDFIKTRAKYGSEDDHLTAWVAKSGKNKVDAVTGSTLSSYATRSSVWDGTDVSGVVVPDGDYEIFIEMGWGKNKTLDHSVFSFAFTKGSAPQQLTPSGDSHYSNITLNWEPVTTLVELNDDAKNLSVFPNPTSGLLKLKINKAISASELIVENSAGSVIYKLPVSKGYSGDLNIDLSKYTNGLYFIILRSQSQQFVYKIMLQK